MTYTHTPGPWEIESTVSAHYIVSEDCEVARVDLIGAIEGLENEDLANARLIAASPAILEALVDLLAGHNLSQDEPEEYPDEEAELQAREVWGRAQQAIDDATTEGER